MKDMNSKQVEVRRVVNPYAAKPTIPMAAAIAVAWGRSRIWEICPPFPLAIRAVRSRIAGQRSEQCVTPVLIVRLVCHLRLVALAGEIPIQQCWGELLAPDGLHSRTSDQHLARPVLNRPDDAFRDGLWGEQGRHRLRLPRQLISLADGLRRVHCWKLQRTKLYERCHHG